MTKTQSRKTQAKRGTLVVLIVFALVAIIGGTYARYSSSLENHNAQFQVARWNVAFKKGDSAISESNKLTFTVANDDYIAEGRIAPSYTATAAAVIDLTGTEVGVDIVATVDTSSIASTLGVTASRITTALTVNGNTVSSGATTTLTYDEVAALTNGEVPVEISVTWDEDNTTANNTQDTTAGSTHYALQNVPVTLTVTQHVEP